MAEEMRLGVLGCGDVAFRTYLPGLDALAGTATVVACTDPVLDRAVHFAEGVSARSGHDCAAFADLAAMLAGGELDGVLNLSPAPYHAETTTQILEAGVHCYSEKPIAGSLADARRLAALARERGLHLLCAPATMASSRFRWLKAQLAAGLLGRPTLATGQMANLGPAAWRDYKGDPAVFYTDRVGPVLDTGVYLLHAITGLFGPAKRVSAVGGIAIPERQVLIPGREGERVAVTAADHVLIHLEWADAAFAQILSSFATPRTKAPVLEIHGELGTFSIPDIATWYDLAAPIDLLRLDPSPTGGQETWQPAGPSDPGPVRQPIQSGPVHFAAVLAGQEAPILTAEHAAHVLEIALAAARSAAEGRFVELETSF
jgi:predicted dehydrogenase